MKKIIFFIFLINISTLSFSQTINFRDSIDVLNYEINLKIGDFNNQKIEGNTVIKMIPIFEKTKILKFDLQGLNVENILINDKKHSDFIYENNIITIKLKKNIATSDTTLITIFYNGKPQKDKYWGGFYFTNKDVFNMGVGMAAVPPNFGRVWYPCIDNFTDKATYNYNITVNSGKQAVCSGSLIDIKVNDNSTITYSWELLQSIPTYLSSVAVADYSLVSSTLKSKTNEVPFQVYVYSGNEKKAEKTFTSIESALQIFETLFGIYSWKRVGFVETNFNSGAMEHATNIAFPSYAIDGTNSYEMLMVHEFAHSWFGNLVTCETANDMWLNEGWARYCEALFVEKHYDNVEFKDYFRKNHNNVLTNVHIADGGYFPIYGLPAELTYGKTVYNKGASVVHSLRNYIGDDLFFESVKKYISDFQFSTANTLQFRDSLSSYTKINLNDFFDFYVFGKGFNHFSVDEFAVTEIENLFKVNLKVNQRIKETNFFANSNKIEITFIDKSFNSLTKKIEFSGEFGDSIYYLNFKPELVILDINEKIADATIDNYKYVSDNEEHIFPLTGFSAQAEIIKDSVFLRIQSNKISAQNISKTDYIISDNHFWTIDCILNENQISAKFYFGIDNFLDKYPDKEKIILYRENENSDWIFIKQDCFKKYIKINNLQKGEYVFAVY